MPGQSLRFLLPMLMAGVAAACGEIGPRVEPAGQTASLGLEMGGSGPGRGARGDTVAIPSLKPAHPAPPPAKPAEPAASKAGDFADAPATTAESSRSASGQPGRDKAGTAVDATRPKAAARTEAPTPQSSAPQSSSSQSSLQVAALPPPLRGPGGLPSDPVEVLRLRTRPPMTPPVDTAFDAAMDRAQASSSTPERPQAPPAAAASAQARCKEAVRAARESVNQYLSLPVERIADTAWVEDALRVTEVAQRACQDQPNEEAATYWRATAFFLHGQYARAALNFRRVADVNGAFNALGYAANLSTLLQSCGDDRASLDAFRLGGLYEAAGHPERAANHYTLAARSSCVPLRDTAEARLRVMAERLARGAAAR